MIKIGIQGHPAKGKEIIQILESLGAVNLNNYSGDNPACYSVRLNPISSLFQV